MKQTSQILLTAVLLFTTALTFAQRKCPSHENLQQMILEHPEMAKTIQDIERHTENYVSQPQGKERAVITIPVVFHIVWRTGKTVENISDAQIQSQLDVMNKDFRKLNTDVSKTPALFSALAADTEIQFCMAQRDPSGAAATGIVRYQSSRTTDWGTSDAVKKPASGGYAPWDATKYLNVWVCSIGGGILGYAQFPGGSTTTDGVVIDYRYFGTNGTATAPFNLGRTATHEVGHWLNLSHIWGDATCGTDYVTDTPTHTTSNGGCPAYPKTNTCGGTTNTEMTMNYMDYTDDNCMYMFSAGQKARMQAVLAAGGSRASLATSNGCQPGTGTTCAIPTGLASASITATGATVNWAAASGAVTYNLQYKTAAATTWTTLSVTGTSRALTGLTAATTYNYKVATVCSGATSAYSTAVNFTTSTATTTCAVPTGLASASITATGATVSWAAASGAVTYNLQYKTAAATTWTTLSVTGTSRALTGLTAATTYNYKVATVCSGATSAYSTAVNFTTSTATTTCAVPTGLASSSITATGATVSWAAKSGAVTYNLQYKTAAATTWTTLSVTGTSRALTGLTAATTYNYKVATVCSGATSAYSTAVNFTTTAVACIDNYESNNSQATAFTLPANTAITALINNSTDQDYFKIVTTAAAPKIKATLSNLPADFDLYLYNASGTLLASSLKSGTNTETVKYNASTVAATYYVRVYSSLGKFSATKCYTLLPQIGATNFREIVENDDENVNIVPSLDFVLAPNPANDEVNINFLTKNSGRSVVTVYDMTGRVVMTKENNSDENNRPVLNVAHLENGLYIISVKTNDLQKSLKLIIQH